MKIVIEKVKERWTARVVVQGIVAGKGSGPSATQALERALLDYEHGQERRALKDATNVAERRPL